MQPAHCVPMVFPVMGPGSADLHEAGVDIDVFHRVHGNANGFQLRETAHSLGVELVGGLRPCIR